MYDRTPWPGPSTERAAFHDFHIIPRAPLAVTGSHPPPEPPPASASTTTDPSTVRGAHDAAAAVVAVAAIAAAAATATTAAVAAMLTRPRARAMVASLGGDWEKWEGVKGGWKPPTDVEGGGRGVGGADDGLTVDAAQEEGEVGDGGRVVAVMRGAFF